MNMQWSEARPNVWFLQDGEYLRGTVRVRTLRTSRIVATWMRLPFDELNTSDGVAFATIEEAKEWVVKSLHDACVKAYDEAQAMMDRLERIG